MKAKSLQRKELSLSSIYEDIKQANENNQFKWFIPHFVYVSPETKVQLISDGYKVSEGTWASLDYGLIIEW